MSIATSASHVASRVWGRAVSISTNVRRFITQPFYISFTFCYINVTVYQFTRYVSKGPELDSGSCYNKQVNRQMNKWMCNKNVYVFAPVPKGAVGKRKQSSRNITSALDGGELAFSCSSRFIAEEGARNDISQETGCAPQPMLTLRCREGVYRCRESNPDYPARSQ